jgi:hypothetical protein
MNNEVFLKKFEVCFLHLKRMRQGLNHIQDLRPITPLIVENMTEENLAFLELFTSRFAKLQDYMGESLFPVVLEFMGTDPNKLTMIDKLNKMEKYYLLESAQQWQNLRDVRNKWTHEYLDSYVDIANCLNDMIEKSSFLEKTLMTISDRCGFGSIFKKSLEDNSI